MKIIQLTFIAIFLLHSAAAFAEERPNILYIYVDDMGWGSLGPNGQFDRKAKGLPYLLTPNLDRLAAEGRNFTRSYGCAVCTPARSSQQCGFHQGHTLADWNNPGQPEIKAMRADEVLMGDALSRAGYAAGYWGKWGFGGSRDMASPTLVNLQTLPTAHGYRHVVAELHHVRAHTFFQPTLWMAPAPEGTRGGLELRPNSMAPYQGNPAYPDLPARQNHPEYPETAYCDDVYCFAALDFVREQAQAYLKEDQPFFGLLAVQVPHSPYGAIVRLPEWDADYAEHPHWGSLSIQAKQWAAMVTRIDGHIGNLLAALEDPNGDGDRSDSIADDTLVIFQSDNGGPDNDAREAFGANGGLRDVKSSIYEGGIRVPTLMRWPGKIEAGSSTDQIIDVTDLLPTFCELAGTDIPVGLDGVSIAPSLTGSGYQRPREFIIHETPRHGDSIIRGRYKLIWQGRKERQLFDLEADHAESENLAKKYPDLVKELETLLLGERVSEPKLLFPKGIFANTYHHWTGKDGDLAASPDNWSDYVYANAGETYLTDDGAPRVSWTASITNGTTAVAEEDLSVLGLLIAGGSTLELKEGVTLEGRNEVRVGEQGSLVLLGGTVTSLRWLEIEPQGTLHGSGVIAADLYLSGRMETENLQVLGDLHIEPSAVWQVSSEVPLTVKGAARLGGELVIDDSSLPPASSTNEWLILKADAIRGVFANEKQRVASKSGATFKIDYRKQGIRLIRE